MSVNRASHLQFVYLLIDDSETVADLYILLFNTIIVRPEYAAHGRDGFYFAENGEHTMYQVGKAICEGMNVMGVHSELEPSAFTQEELVNYFGVSDLPRKSFRLF